MRKIMNKYEAQILGIESALGFWAIIFDEPVVLWIILLLLTIQYIDGLREFYKKYMS